MNAAALELLLALIAQTRAVAAKIKAAHAEGRELTPAELDEFAQESDQSRDALRAAIDAAGGESTRHV